jgi:hypothetical protein
MQAYQENISAKVSGVLSPVLGVQVTVTDTATGNPAALYSDNGVTPLPPGPLVTDETGYFGFHAANGRYTLTFSSPQIKLGAREVQLYDPADDVPLTQAQAAASSGASKIGYGTRSVENTLNAPYVITGVATIKNPTWGAPVDNAEDPAAAAANAAAAQLMLNSGARRIEFDDKSRCVNATLLIPSAMQISGAGRSSGGLIWTGGDSPLLARASYQNASGTTASNIRLHHLLLQDKAASRVNYWTIDLTNGDSCGMEDCWIDIQGGGSASDKYGIALGAARGGTYSGLAFVAHIRKCRIASGKVLLNTSDWYVSGSELWGNGRDHALEISAGGTVCEGTQIVPGSAAGIYLFNDSGFNIDTLKVADVYFDGSYDSVVTGTGIKSAPSIGLITSEINGCNFWHLNGSGIDLASTAACLIDATFADCDSMGTGLPDIIIAAMQSTKIEGRHFRNANAPKSNAARVLAPIVQLTGQAGFPLNEVNCQASYDSTYLSASYTNPNSFKSTGGSSLTKVPYTSLPDVGQFKGEMINVAGSPRFSDGTTWHTLTMTTP